MRALGLFIACLASCIALTLGVAGLALGGDPGSAGLSGFGGGASAFEGSPLVIPGAQPLFGGEQERAQREVELDNPIAVQERVASRTRYQGLSAAGAAKLDRDAFPDVVDREAGGPPQLPAGDRITTYLSDHAAQVNMGTKHAVLESIMPIAARAATGKRIPIDLALEQTGNVFQPVTPSVKVHIAKRVADGVSLPGSGVSLTPVDAHGHALGGSEGTLDGATVFFGGTGMNSDTLVKPTTMGFDVQTLLRSADSPQRLYFHVGLPRGARLSQEANSGNVQVLIGNRSIASIPVPSAADAGGTSVSVSTSLAGDTLVLNVPHRDGDYHYPIAVDPEFKEINDKLLVETGGQKSNWVYGNSNNARFSDVCPTKNSAYLESCGTAEYGETEWSAWAYETKGESKIYDFNSKSEGHNKGAQVESIIWLLSKESVGSESIYELVSKKAGENSEPLSSEYTKTEYGNEPDPSLCAKNSKKEVECGQAAGANGNAVLFQQAVQKKPTNYKFSDALTEGTVFLSEKEGFHATTGFNTGTAELSGEVENAEHKKEILKRANVMDGGGWLTEHSGAIEFTSEDKGIGVSASKLEYENAGKWEVLTERNYLEGEKLCKGVQCNAQQKQFWVLEPKLPNGEDKIRYRAKDAMNGTESTTSEGTATVKVDTEKPNEIAISGLPQGNELSEREYNLTVYARDGEGSTVASSGVASIALYIDKARVGIKGEGSETEGKCSVAKGECTASAKWTLKGSELGAGKHDIEVVALDKAGNEAQAYEPISIRHSTPVALGPGSVDLQSGDFALKANDVSLGSGLTVDRNYSSRALEEGDEGPLGPQWNLNLGSTESLIELVDHSMLLTDGNGRQTIFAKTEGGYESPTGDSNLKLTVEEKEKKPVAYYLTNAAAHTNDKFILPSGGSREWVPTRQEGTVPTDTVTYAYQTAIQHDEYQVNKGEFDELRQLTLGSEGNVWYANMSLGKIGKITPTGAITEYGADGCSPNGIAAGPNGNIWFSCGSEQIGEMSPAGTVWTWNVPGGESATGIASGPDGDVWFTEPKESKIAKITTSGVVSSYSLPAGSEPNEIASGPENDMWFTDYGTRKIGKITTGGSVSEYEIHSEGRPVGIVNGPGGDAWFTAPGGVSSGVVGKITPGGTPTEYHVGTATSQPRQIVTGPDGNIWAAQPTKLSRVTPSGEVTEYPTSLGSEGLAVGADGNLWLTGAERIGVITTAGVITEPTEAVAPPPAKVECPKEKLKVGCRVLKFVYASATTATGEAESQWGNYIGRLQQVLYEGYNPATKKVEEPGIAVAEYRYDNRGRLRAEWDPRVSTPLKSKLGYDEEGHVTALTEAGQESWVFNYGTTSGDAGTGRILKVDQAPATTELWKGETLKNTAAPTITGAPYEHVILSASTGSWSSGSPITYAYQWYICQQARGEGQECNPILGADSATYEVTQAEVAGFHTLFVKVTATNGGGSVSTVSSKTGYVQSPIEEVDDFFSSGDPLGITSGPNGSGGSDMWSTVSGENKIAKITMEWATTQYASGEKHPTGITAGPDGNIWFVESEHVGRMTPSGGLTTFTIPGSKVSAKGIAAGPDGNLWFTESANKTVGKMNTKGEILGEYKTLTAEPTSIVTGPDKNLWFTMCNILKKAKIGKITTSGVITEYELPGKEPCPTGITSGPDGNLWYTNFLESKIGKITTSGEITEYSLPAKSNPEMITGGEGLGNGNLYFTESGSNKIGRITTSGEITEYALPAESKPYGIAFGTDGNVWYTDSGTGRIGKLLTNLMVEGKEQTPQPGWTVEYGVGLEGSGLPAQMGVNTGTHKPEPGNWGQTDDPVEATSIFPPDSPQWWPATKYTRATTYYLDGEGRAVNVESPSTSSYGSVSTTEYNEENDVVRTLSSDDRITALEAGEKSLEQATLLSTYNTYRYKCSHESEFTEEREGNEPGTRLCEVEGPAHEVKYMTGKEQKEGLARSHVRYFYDEKVPAEGPKGEKFSEETFNLVTEAENLTKLIESNGKELEEIEARTTATSYSGQKNLGWALRAPTSVTEAAETGGAKIVHTTLYNEATGQVTETRAPKGQSGSSAHDVKTVYYTPEEEAEVSSCRKHPEWAGLACVTMPAKQPETSKVPNLPVTETAYDMWDQPEIVTETITFPPEAATVRTNTDKYDSAGRLLNSETVVTGGNKDKALPSPVSYEYETNEAGHENSQGKIKAQKMTVSGKVQTISTKYNTLGQEIEYADASGANVAKFTYGGSENDFQVTEMSDSSNGGKGGEKSRQTYAYNPTTMQLETLWDSAAETFKASYDSEGKLVSEVYPNGMCANYTYNSVGEATHLEYIKTSNCAESKPTVWYSESVGATSRGEGLNRSSTLATENYTYDTLGRLTETQETPVAGECVVRLYSYDEESNRTSSTSRKAESKCATSGGSEEKHTYDEANRLTDAGIEYESLGNITKLAAADAEKHELTTGYYVDGAVATQSQNGVTNEYKLDPVGRVIRATSGAKTTIDHYDGAGEAVAWACEESGATETCESGKWTRSIPGIDGSLAAEQTNGGTPVLLLHDLHGDVVATAALSPTETKLLSTYNSTEFGVPNAEKTPPRFAWLGAVDVSRSLSSGVITYGATSYVPQTGKALQSEQVETPGYPLAVGGGTAYVAQVEPWVWQGAAREAAEAPGIGAAEQEEAEIAACDENAADCGEGSEIDPGGCVGVGSLDDSGNPEYSHHKIQPYLNIKCHNADSAGKLALCLDELYLGGIRQIACTSWMTIGKYANKSEFALLIPGLECKGGSVYELSFGYFQAPLSKAQWENGKEERCKKDLEETYIKDNKETAPWPLNKL
jgi:streptogramin lyase